MPMFFVDCEAAGPCPVIGQLTEFGVVKYPDGESFHGWITNRKGDTPAEGREKLVFQNLYDWLLTFGYDRNVFISDNPAFDWQWINYGFYKYQEFNPFGHSARRISDFYAGLCGDFSKTMEWKKLRITKHDHNPVNDAMGNMEAFKRLLAGER
jgi:hypothetical protein